MIRLLRDLAQPGRLIVVSTHDDRMIPIADQIVEMAPHFRADIGPPERMTFDAGNTIYEQGDRGELIYVVEEGEVETFRVRDDRTEEHVATFGPGEYFGELGPLLDFPREATARAKTRVVVTAYGQKDFKERILTPQRQREPERPSIIGNIGASQVENIRPSLIGAVGMSQVAPAPAAASSPAEPSVVTPAGTPLRFCGNCGTPRESGDRFCAVCGRSFPTATT